MLVMGMCRLVTSGAQGRSSTQATRGELAHSHASASQVSCDGLSLTLGVRPQVNAGHARHTKLTYSRAKTACAMPRPGSAAAAALSAVEHAGGGMERRLLCREDLRRSLQLREQPVELYWPEDETWWPARITEVRRPSGYKLFA